jgi:hypothetical protein
MNPKPATGSAQPVGAAHTHAPCFGSRPRAAADRAGLPVRERKQGRKSRELQLVDDGISGEGKGTNGLLSTSRIA